MNLLNRLFAILLSITSPLFAADPPGEAEHYQSLDSDAGTKLRVHFIDIGGGMAALIETPGGKHILIDGGKKGSSDYEDYVGHFVDGDFIDILIVTHADDDHFHNMTKLIVSVLHASNYWKLVAPVPTYSGSI